MTFGPRQPETYTKSHHDGSDLNSLSRRDSILHLVGGLSVCSDTIYSKNLCRIMPDRSKFNLGRTHPDDLWSGSEEAVIREEFRERENNAILLSLVKKTDRTY